MNDGLNQELMLAHQFIKQQYQTYLNSNRIKSNPERRAWAHAVQITGHIANNTHITPKQTPTEYKKKNRPELYNTVYES